MRTHAQSERAFEEAKRFLVGGVNSPVRAYGAVGGTPPVIARGEGCRLVDVDGNVYIDYVGSWGPLIVGHRHPKVVAALKSVIDEVGVSFGAPTELETILARKVLEAVPSIQRLRFVNSGTEACMSAIRLARAATGRDVLVKFEGCYHGHSDSLLVEAGSGAATFGHPNSPGVPEAVTSLTAVLPFNDLDRVRAFGEEQGQRVAAILVEPVAGNMGLVPPEPGFLEGLKECCQKWGALLIFDEVMTGFRVARGGAQAHYGIEPDLTVLGKVVGGGLPVAAYGGRRELMDQVAPAGPVYQAGTLSGNPLGMAAGAATLDLIAEPGFFERLTALGERLTYGLRRAASEAKVPMQVHQVGGMVGLFFRDEPVRSFRDAADTDDLAFRSFFAGMLERGIYLPPSRFEAFFLSSAHEEKDIDETIAAAAEALGVS